MNVYCIHQTTDAYDGLTDCDTQMDNAPSFILIVCHDLPRKRVNNGVKSQNKENTPLAENELCELMAKHRNRIWGILIVSGDVLQSLICFGCLLYFARSHHRRSTSRTIAFCTFVGIASFIFSGVLQGIHAWIWYTTDSFNPTGFGALMLNLSLLCWSLGQFCSYLIFVYRLKDAFVESAYYLRKCTIIYIVSLQITQQIMWIILSIVRYVFYSGSAPKSELNVLYQIQLWIPSLILILDVVISISMTYLFVSRLFMVMRGQTRTVHDQHRRMNALNESLNIHGQNRRLLELSVKITILSISALLSSLIFFAVSADAYIYGVRHGFDSGRYIFKAFCVNAWLAIGNVINCVCLILFLQSTKVMYEKLCCCCIAFCSCCIRRALLRAKDLDDVCLQSSESISETSHGIASGGLIAGNAKNELSIVISESGQML